MAWDDLDKARRVTVAKELSRQEFWKTVYVEAYKIHANTDKARSEADNALRLFEFEFRENLS